MSEITKIINFFFYSFDYAIFSNPVLTYLHDNYMFRQSVIIPSFVIIIRILTCCFFIVYKLIKLTWDKI